MTRSHFLILTTAFIINLLLFHPAHAEERLTLAVQPTVPFAIQLDSPVEPNTTYGLKICGSDVAVPLNNPTVNNLNCSGETWNMSQWLSQNESWQDFPTLTSQSDGRLKGFVSGKLADPLPSFLYIILLPVGESSSHRMRALQSYQLTNQPAPYTVELKAYLTDGEQLQQGYFTVLESDGTLHYIPSFATLPEATSLFHDSITLGYLNLVGEEQVAPQPFRLQDPGHYVLALNPPPSVPAHPALRAPSDLHPNQTNLFQLETTRPYNGEVAWYLDGLLAKQNRDHSFSTTFSRSGQGQLVAYLLETGETALAPYSVSSYSHISLESVLPNPIGSDIGNEEIVLRNQNTAPVTLAKWHLQSRQSQTSILIEGTILAHDTLVIKTSNRLINSNGIYDLLNESGEIVDTLSYTTLTEGDRLTRTGLLWQAPVQPQETLTTPTQQVGDKVTLTGTVIHPQGKTFDIQTETHGIVHAVIHTNFAGEKPRLHQGDQVRISGIWKRSKKGLYLSIRQGGEVILTEHATQVSRSKKARKSTPLKPHLIEKAQASTFGPVSSAQAHAPPGLPLAPLDLPQPEAWIRWLLIITITLGVLLALPSRRLSSV